MSLKITFIKIGTYEHSIHQFVEKIDLYKLNNLINASSTNQLNCSKAIKFLTEEDSRKKVFSLWLELEISFIY